MDQDHPIEEHPSVKILIRFGEREGFVYLSSLYGSNIVEMDITVPEGEIPELLCFNCKEPFPRAADCPECSGSMVLLKISDGPEVEICNRRGCTHHAIRFGQWENLPIASIMRRGVVSVKEEKPLSQITNILVNTNLNVLPVVSEE